MTALWLKRIILVKVAAGVRETSGRSSETRPARNASTRKPLATAANLTGLRSVIRSARGKKSRSAMVEKSSLTKSAPTPSALIALTSITR